MAGRPVCPRALPTGVLGRAAGVNPMARLWLHRHGHAGGGCTVSELRVGQVCLLLQVEGGAQAAATEWQELVKIPAD